jgi:hypothetical protein
MAIGRRREVSELWERIMGEGRETIEETNPAHAYKTPYPQIEKHPQTPVDNRKLSKYTVTGDGGRVGRCAVSPQEVRVRLRGGVKHGN